MCSQTSTKATEKDLRSVKFQSGDIFLTDCMNLGPRFVKFLMTYPTLYHFAYHWIIGKWIKKGWKPDEVRYYHAGLLAGGDRIIEQQWKVKFSSTGKLFKKKCIVWRKPGITLEQRQAVVRSAVNRIGDTYDWLFCIGGLLTFLTTIKAFSKYIQFKNKDICCHFVAFCYKGIDNFGQEYYWNVDTDTIDDYCMANAWENMWRIK